MRSRSPTAGRRPWRIRSLIFLLSAVGCWLSVSGDAHAAPSVAVMPFKDLTGAHPNVGEAIRETVTSDLKDVPGLRVIERANIDKVLSEQNLQANRADLDPLSTVKVGKLLGATLMVAGGYQRAGGSVRLTARFVSVETGEIVGTAKVDGKEADLLALQDRVTIALLKSAGLAKAEPRAVDRFAKRTRPKLKSWRPIELYGDAVVEKDEQKKHDLLKQAVDADPQFTYASRDLDALEQRMRRYNAAAEQEQQRADRELADRLAREKDPVKVYTATQQLGMRMLTEHRYRKARALYRALYQMKPPEMFAAQHDLLVSQILTCSEALKEDDAVLSEGERFLKAHPESPFFSMVQMRMNATIERKRQIEQGTQEIAGALAELSPVERQDPCVTGRVYKEKMQFASARRDLEACLRSGRVYKPVPWLPLFLLVFTSWEQGDFKAARAYADQLRQQYPEQYRNVKQVEAQFPVED